ncbi:MAG: hypothetical protein WA061_02235 [Microgenomates group bacterium]
MFNTFAKPFVQLFKVVSEGVRYLLYDRFTDTAPTTLYTSPAVTAPVPSLGSDLVVNGGFATDTDWTKEATWTISGNVANALGSGNITATVPPLTVDVWYQSSYDNISRVSGSTNIRIGAVNNPLHNNIGTFVETQKAGTSGLLVRSVGFEGSIDNVIVKPLTLSTLFASITTQLANISCSVKATLTAGTQAGVVARLDSSSSPANFLIAYHDGTNIVLDKCVGGVYTNLINTAATYAADRKLRVITYHSDATTLKVRVYYNDVLIGAEQTVTDAGIRQNVLHGNFSTYVGNTFDYINVYPRGSDNEYSKLDDY